MTTVIVGVCLTQQQSSTTVATTLSLTCQDFEVNHTSQKKVYLRGLPTSLEHLRTTEMFCVFEFVLITCHISMDNLQIMVY